MTLKPANSKDNSGRKYSGGGPRPDNKAFRVEEAQKRNEAWAKLSPAQQLKALDERFGKGKGATKQRARLQAAIDNPKAAKFKGTPVSTAQVPDEIKNDTRPERSKDRRERERTERPSK